MKDRIPSFFDLGFRQSVRQRPASTPDRPPTRAQRPEAPERPSAAPARRVDVTIALIVLAVIALSIAIAVPVASPEPPGISPIPLFGIILLFGGAIALVLAATILYFLRRLQNPTYWESACWILLVLGIFARQLTSARDEFQFSMGALAVSAVVGLAILPGTMRWLNRIPRRPGLAHVAVPFSLGFFVDLGQVLTTKYLVQLPWLSQ